MANLSMKQAATEAANIGAARKGPTPGNNDTKITPLKSSLAEADAATKPETMNSSPDTKLESIQIAEDTAAQASNTPAPEKAEESSTTSSSAPEKAEDEESSTTPSAEPSAVVESDDTSTTATPAGSIAQKHRGSSVSSADPETIKELEQSTAIPEEEDEDDEDEKDDKEDKENKEDKDEEQPKTQDQEAAVAEKASISVED